MTGRVAIDALTTTRALSAEPASVRSPSTATDAALFRTTLAQTSAARTAAGAQAAAEATPDAPQARSVSQVPRGSRSGELTPEQQFESFVLRSFVESMLPADNTSFYGEGTAGQIWKSMLAEHIGDEIASAGGVGIADLVGSRASAAGSKDLAATGAASLATHSAASAAALGRR